MKRGLALGRLAAAAGVGTVLLASAPRAQARVTTPSATTKASALAAAAPEAGTAGSLTGEVEAFGVRVEYDLPLPAGTGTIPAVIGDIGRANSSDNAHGLAGAPSRLDAVVGGEYVDPNGAGGGKPMRSLPQAECFSPGAALDTVFRFPTDTQAETASTPPTSVSTAQCAAGPYLEMHAADAGIGIAYTPSAAFAPVVTSGAATADGVSRTVHDQLVSDDIAHVSGLSILGVIDIGSVSVSGHSTVNGKRGGAATAATVTLADMTLAGVPASLTNNQITVAGQSAPVGSPAGQALLAQVNQQLKPVGCTATVLAHPADYPQGFVLARKPPDLGVAADGHLASSMQGGMLFVCNLPKSVTSQLGGFSPERVQVLVGFAFTSAQALANTGGFGLGDLARPLGGSARGPVGPMAGTQFVRGSNNASTITVPQTGDQAIAAIQPRPAAPGGATPPNGQARLAGGVLAVGQYRLDHTVRLLLFAVCLGGWLILSGIGIRAVRGVSAG